MQGASPAAGAPMGILRCQRGSVTVEGALVAVLLGVLLLGVIDFGLAFRRQSELANAVRAGTQFALGRRPQQGNVDPIRDAVYQTAPFVEGTAGPGLAVALYCECQYGKLGGTSCRERGGQSVLI